MTVILLVVHILVCVFLIGIVLIQGGKGAELGSAFGGGSSQTLFGGRGAATFLGKMTTVVAVVFMITSLLLAVMSIKQRSVSDSSILDEGAPQTTVPVQQGETAEKAGVKTRTTETPAEKPSK